MPLGISVLGRRRRVTTRKPGDLPSAVVTREDVGRGVQALASPELLSAQWWDLVRCDVPLTSYRGLNHVFHHHPPPGVAIVLLASSFLVPLLSWAFPARTRSKPHRPNNCRRSRSARPPTRTGPAPNQPMMKGRARAASRPIRRRPTIRIPRRGPAPTSLRKAADRAEAERPSGNSPASSARPRPSSPRRRLRTRRRKRCKRSSPRRRACS